MRWQGGNVFARGRSTLSLAAAAAEINKLVLFLTTGVFQPGSAAADRLRNLALFYDIGGGGRGAAGAAVAFLKNAQALAGLGPGAAAAAGLGLLGHRQLIIRRGNGMSIARQLLQLRRFREVARWVGGPADKIGRARVSAGARRVHIRSRDCLGCARGSLRDFTMRACLCMFATRLARIPWSVRQARGAAALTRNYLAAKGTNSEETKRKDECNNTDREERRKEGREGWR